MCRISADAGFVLRTLEMAASIDADAAEVWAPFQHQRRVGLKRVRVDAGAETSALRYDEDTVTDTMWCSHQTRTCASCTTPAGPSISSQHAWQASCSACSSNESSSDSIPAISIPATSCAWWRCRSRPRIRRPGDSARSPWTQIHRCHRIDDRLAAEAATAVSQNARRRVTPRVPSNAGSGSDVVEDLLSRRPHSVVPAIGPHWPPAGIFRWPPTVDPPPVPSSCARIRPSS